MKIRTITKRFWLFGPVTGLICAAAITFVFTTIDWARNFAGIFRDQSGANWPVIFETAVSWFLPSFIYITIVATIAHLVIGGMLTVYRGRFAKNRDNAST